MNGLSFLVTTPLKEKVIFFREKRFSRSTTPEELLMDVELMISENEILNTQFTDISIIYSTSIYSLVPTPLFDETKASEYLKFNSKILPNDYVAYDVLENSGIVVTYVPFMNINNFFFEKYGSFNYYHTTTILLQTLLENEKYSLPKMFLHFQNNHCDCVVLKDGNLQLCNTFAYKTPEDFIYYTLFCMEQLKLNPETLPVVLYGDIDESDDNYKIAYTYIRNIEFGKSHTAALDMEGGPHKHFVLKNVD